MSKTFFLKRCFDFFISLLAMTFFSPVWFIISLAIYIEDGRPVYFYQERVGENGRKFQAIKFRTMKYHGDRRHRIIDLEKDTRVTKVGKFLRTTAIDELPQLVNIIKGDMSFVGPRALPYEIGGRERFRYPSIEEVPGYHVRSRVRPGLTGIAQIYAPKDISRQNKFRYDNLYVKKMSLQLDVKLILISIWITLRGKWESREKKV